MIKIDKGVPMPPLTRPLGRTPIYPWKDMAVGDSFLVAGKAQGRNAQTAIDRAHKRTGYKFSSRTTPEGVRVWRVS